MGVASRLDWNDILTLMERRKDPRSYDAEPEDSEEVARRWGIDLEVEGEIPEWFKERGYGPKL